MTTVKAHARRGTKGVKTHARKGEWSGQTYNFVKPVQGAVGANYHKEILLSKTGQPLFKRKEVLTKIKKSKKR